MTDGAARDELTGRRFWAAAWRRALRSFAQALLTLGGLNETALFSERWSTILIAAAGYALTSVLTSVALGLPEAPPDGRAPDS